MMNWKLMCAAVMMAGSALLGADIKPAELRAHFVESGLEAGKLTGLGPRGIDGRGDPVFGPLPFTGIIYMGIARKAV